MGFKGGTGGVAGGGCQRRPAKRVPFDLLAATLAGSYFGSLVRMTFISG